MDLDHARRLIQEAADMPPLSDIVLDLLAVIGNLDDHLARLKLRVQDLEREHAPSPPEKEPT